MDQKQSNKWTLLVGRHPLRHQVSQSWSHPKFVPVLFGCLGAPQYQGSAGCRFFYISLVKNGEICNSCIWPVYQHVICKEQNNLFCQHVKWKHNIPGKLQPPPPPPPENSIVSPLMKVMTLSVHMVPIMKKKIARYWEDVVIQSSNYVTNVSTVAPTEGNRCCEKVIFKSSI